MKEFEKGELYKIRFYDHCIGSPEKIICEVVGWIISQDKDHLSLTYWMVDTKCEETKMENVEWISIIKSCIVRSKKLR